MDIVIALDFDGTLYPITDYDSEQMLLHLSGRDGAEELIERDKKGGYDPIIFNDDFEKIISGLDESYITEAARIIHERIGKDDLAPLRRLQEKGCHIAVISCGSNRLIRTNNSSRAKTGRCYCSFSCSFAQPPYPSGSHRFAGDAVYLESRARNGSFAAHCLQASPH